MSRPKPPFPTLDRSHPLAVGLVGAWPFWEGGGLRFYDLSGNGNDAIPSGTQYPWVAGQHGWAVDFAEGAFADVGINVFDLGIRRHATFACLVETDNISNHTLISDWQGSLGMALRHGPSAGDIEFYVYPNNHRITVSGPVVAGVWYFLVGVMDGANMHLYLDGVLKGSTTLGEDIGNSAATIKIGQRGDLGAGQGTDGRIGGAWIYNRSLSPAEVEQLYHDPFAMYRRRRVLMTTAAPVDDFDGADLLLIGMGMEAY